MSYRIPFPIHRACIKVKSAFGLVVSRADRTVMPRLAGVPDGFAVIRRFVTAQTLGLLVILSFFMALPNAEAKQVPPRSDRLVNDYTGKVLSSAQKRRLEQKLVAYDDSTSTQIAVVIENSLEGDDMFDYTQRLYTAWGIGSKGKDNGVLIYIPFDDHKIRIHTGYGAEGFLTDAMSKRIIENVLIPAFREAKYYQGLDKATDIIIELGNGEYVQDDYDASFEDILPFIIFFIIILVIIIIIAKNNNGKGGGYYRGGRYTGGGWSGGGWHMGGGGWSGGGGGFGGGGFGGFGGGMSGGGGASGGW